MWDSVVHLDSWRPSFVSNFVSNKAKAILLNQGLSFAELLNWSGLFHCQAEYRLSDLGLSVSPQLYLLNASFFSVLQSESQMDWIDRLRCRFLIHLLDFNRWKFLGLDSLFAVSGMTVLQHWRVSRYWCERIAQDYSISLFGSFWIFLHLGCFTPLGRMKGRISCWRAIIQSELQAWKRRIEWRCVSWRSALLTYWWSSRRGWKGRHSIAR